MRLLIALGGNAILRRKDAGTFREQSAHVESTMRPVAALAADGHEIVLTHGNGPIVGNIVIRNEAARDEIAPMPLFVDGADSQGGIGFLLQMVLGNELRDLGSDRPVATVVTQVEVDLGDPAFQDPTKPIGPYYGKDEAERLTRNEGWFFTEQEQERGTFRRVVPSPLPLRIVEADVVRRLADSGIVVIAAGGGGVPVIEGQGGRLEGVDAVVDKDHSSALLAREIGADLFVVLMEEDRVYLAYGTLGQRPIERITALELRSLAVSDAFAKGSMRPKVLAVTGFVDATGRDAVICCAEEFRSALRGDAGTRVTSG